MSEDIDLKRVMFLIDEHKPGEFKHYVFETPLPGMVGIILADAARHIATAKAAEMKIPYGAILAPIVEMFNAEINKPTTILQGGLEHEPSRD